MKIATFILLILLPLNILSQNNIEEYLDSLDTEIIKSSNYVLKKQNEINQLKKNLETSSFPEDKYSFCKRIFIEYSKYQTDSAQLYLNKWYEYGLQSNDSKKIQEILLYKAYIYTLRSDFVNANKVLESLPAVENIEPELRYLYSRIQFERLLHSNIISNKKDSLSGIRIWNKFSQFIPKDDLYYSIYYTNIFSKNINDSIFAVLKEQAECKDITPQKAYLQFSLSHLSGIRGYTDQAVIYAICSAITDIKMVNYDSQSILYIIQLLSQHIDNKEQLSRLYRYTQFYSENVSSYKDFGRSLQLIEIQNQVQRMYKQLIDEKQQVYSITFITCIIVIIVSISIIYVFLKKYKRQRRTLTDITDNYNAMRDLTQKMQKENDIKTDKINILEAEIDKKNNFFIDSLRTQVGLLTKFSQTKKTILNLITASQLREAKKLLSDSLVDNNEQNFLYESFDEIFLSIHPDFVERFNKLLNPDAQIKQESPNRLTIELRIYALVCLGITDSISIAKLLNYSPQTIYNYRLKIRHSSVIPEKDFAKTVMSLYKTPNTENENLHV